MKKKIFISYSSEDRKYAERIAKKLEKADVTVWTDSKIPAGVEWAKVIQKSLNESSLVIVLVSDSWINSEWAAFELGAAYGKGKKIVPILLTNQNKKISGIITQFEFLDAKKQSDDSIVKKIEEIIEQQ
jgi:predicted nucleotide-binding protein